MKLSDGQAIASALREHLAPHCLRCEIAGGVRREKADPHDIELVAIASPARPRPKFGLGAPAEAYKSALIFALWNLERTGVLRKLKGGDRYVQYEILNPLEWGAETWSESEKLDLFIVTPETWGYQLTIRTGPSDFSHWLVTPRRQGGALPKSMTEKNARLWLADSMVPIETPEEIDFLNAVGVGWIEPKRRRAAWGSLHD